MHGWTNWPRCIDETPVHAQLESLHAHEDAAVAREHDLAHMRKAQPAQLPEAAVRRTFRVGELLGLSDQVRALGEAESEAEPEILMTLCLAARGMRSISVLMRASVKRASPAVESAYTRSRLLPAFPCAPVVKIRCRGSSDHRCLLGGTNSAPNSNPAVNASNALITATNVSNPTA